MVAVCERSSNTDFSTPSLSSRLTPPMRSEAFSFSASQRAASLLAPLPDRTYTDAPRAMRSLPASAWIDTRMSALLSGAADAVAQRHEIIAVAHLRRPHAGLRAHEARQLLRNGQYHFLFLCTARPLRTGIDATVSGIDGDDEVTEVPVSRRDRRGGSRGGGWRSDGGRCAI